MGSRFYEPFWHVYQKHRFVRIVYNFGASRFQNPNAWVDNDVELNHWLQKHVVIARSQFGVVISTKTLRTCVEQQANAWRNAPMSSHVNLVLGSHFVDIVEWLAGKKQFSKSWLTFLGYTSINEKHGAQTSFRLVIEAIDQIAVRIYDALVILNDGRLLCCPSYVLFTANVFTKNKETSSMMLLNELV